MTSWCPPPPLRMFEDLGFKGSGREALREKQGCWARSTTRPQAHSSTFIQIKGEVILGKMHQQSRCGGKRPFHPPGG